MENRKRDAEEAVKEWLSERGYEYEVRTYTPGGTDVGAVRKEKDTISIPAGIEDVEGFMEQFAKTFESIDGIAGLKRH